MLILVPTPGEATHLFGDRAPVSENPVRIEIAGHTVEAALCGFGPAAAGVLAARAMAACGASSCVLAGIAGTYDSGALPMGAVLQATEVRMEGIGRGAGEAFKGPVEWGYDVVPAASERPGVRDRLTLPAPRGGVVSGAVSGVLVTVASTTADAADATRLRRRHPDALAEDMEAFPVALACQLAGVHLTVLRGVSNGVGAAKDTWERERALEAVRVALEELIVGERARRPS